MRQRVLESVNEGVVEECGGEESCVYQADITLLRSGTKVKFAYTLGDSNGITNMSGYTNPIHVKAPEGMVIEFLTYDVNSKQTITHTTTERIIPNLDAYLLSHPNTNRNSGVAGIYYKLKPEEGGGSEEIDDFSDLILEYYVRAICPPDSYTCDQDCLGHWSPCTESCEKGKDREYIVEVHRSGVGLECSRGEADDCDEDDGTCKVSDDGNLIAYIIIGIFGFIFILGIVLFLSRKKPIHTSFTQPPVMGTLTPKITSPVSNSFK